jgi:site-specific DNA-methyltransferase (adenine-specific)
MQEMLPLVTQGCDPSIEITVTSPPYNVGIPYDGYSDDLPYSEYLADMAKAFRVLYDATMEGGRLCLNVPCGTGSGERYRPIHHDLDQEARKAGWLPFGTIVWRKASRGSTFAWGSWASPSSPALIYSFEFIQLYHKGPARMEPRNRLPDITGEEFGQWIDAFWSWSSILEDRSGQHPASFPSELVHRLLKLLSFPGALVCDPFCAAATTGVTALSMGRRFLGFDVSRHYVDMTRRALENVRPIPAVLSKLDRWVMEGP